MGISDGGMGGREERKEALWRGNNLAGSHSRCPGTGECFDLLRLVGCGDKEIQQREAQGRHRPPPVANEIEVTRHGKPLDF